MSNLQWLAPALSLAVRGVDISTSRQQAHYQYFLHRDLIREFLCRTSRVATHEGYRFSDVREVANVMVRTTGRITLLSPSMDAEHFDSIPFDRSACEVYADAANDGNEYAKGVLTSEVGERMCEVFGIQQYTNEDGEEQWAPSDELELCEHCGEWMSQNDVVRAFSSTDLNEWDSYHPRCAERSSDVGTCSISGYTYDAHSQSTVTVDGADVWQEYCEYNDLIVYDDEAGEWCRPGSRRRLLAGYHEVRRSWQESPCRTNGHVGVELELGFPHYNRDEFLQDFTQGGRFTDGRPFIIEHDGSLDGNVPDGCELISSPLPLYDGYQAAGSPWRSVLKDLLRYGAAGWYYRKSAGLHVNLCVTGESDEVVMKYAMFINTAYAMSCFIAGRGAIYGRVAEARGGYDAYTPRVLRDPVNAGFGAVFNHGKYAAVNRRNADCLETRIFGSNLRYEGFMAAVEYCVAVMAYVRLVDVWQVVSPIAAAEFRGWLGTQTKRFPNLVARLGIVQHDPSRAVPSTAKLVPILAAA